MSHRDKTKIKNRKRREAHKKQDRLKAMEQKLNESYYDYPYDDDPYWWGADDDLDDYDEDYADDDDEPTEFSILLPTDEESDNETVTIKTVRDDGRTTTETTPDRVFSLEHAREIFVLDGVKSKTPSLRTLNELYPHGMISEKLLRGGRFATVVDLSKLPTGTIIEQMVDDGDEIHLFTETSEDLFVETFRWLHRYDNLQHNRTVAWSDDDIPDPVMYDSEELAVLSNAYQPNDDADLDEIWVVGAAPLFVKVGPPVKLNENDMPMITKDGEHLLGADPNDPSTTGWLVKKSLRAAS